MVKQASKARATLLAVGVQAVSELDDHVGPESSPLAIKYRHSGVTSQGPSQLGSSSHSHSHINSNGNGNGNSSSGEGDLVAPTEDDPSVHILHSTNTDVQPELLLSDARLKEIRDGPLMKNSAHLAQLRDLEEHLHAFKQEDALIPAQEIPALMNKLNVLYGRHVVEVTLQLQPKGKKAFQEGTCLVGELFVCLLDCACVCLTVCVSACVCVCYCVLLCVCCVVCARVHAFESLCTGLFLSSVAAGFKRIEKRFDTLERRREAVSAIVPCVHDK